jgi:peptide deformylase
VKIVTDELELRKPCERVKLSEVNGIVKTSIDLVKTMIKNDGVGLAANQVGIHKTFFIAEIRGTVKLFINPKVINCSVEKNISQEGCLSFPGVHKDIERSNEIIIQYFDYRAKKIVKESYTGFSARVIQHEYDHLQGICCILDKAIEKEEI